MMSRCTVCGTPTDLALSDALTSDDVRSLGTDPVPLIGTCGERVCVDKQLDRLRSARTAKPSDETWCPNCGMVIRRDTWYAHYHVMHPRLDAPAFQWVYDNQKER